MAAKGPSRTPRRVAKLVKALSKEEETDLFVAVSKLSENDQKIVEQVLSKVSKEVQKIAPDDNDKLNRKRKRSIPKRLVFEKFMTTLKHNLEKYEEGEEATDYVNLTLEPLGECKRLSDEQLSKKYKEIDRLAGNLKKIKLLVVCYKGRIFNEMKYGNRKVTWDEFCMNINISVSTANRFINFSNWCRVYPRLVVSGIGLTTLESYRKKLDKHLEMDDELRRKLEGPVREMVLEAKKVVIRGIDLPAHVDEDHQPMERTNNDWNPGYEWRDEISDTMDRGEIEEESSSSDDFEDTLLDDEG